MSPTLAFILTLIPSLSHYPQVRDGKHPSRLSDYGLSREVVLARPAFRRYCERFGVRGCGAAGMDGVDVGE